MKNHFYYLCLLLGLVFGLMTFTACGDDDEDPTLAQPSTDAADRDAAGNLKISAINFLDENFRSFLLSQGYGADGVLTEKEIADIKSLEIPSLKIHSLNGIAFFTYLEELDCEHNEITSLDMSKNVRLTKLACHSNLLTSLDVSKNIALKDLHCPHNKLTSLDVSKNLNLTRLSCSDNQLTSLDVSKNTLLEELYCDKNQLTSLDVSNNPKLIDLRYDTDKVTISGWPK